MAVNKNNNKKSSIYPDMLDITKTYKIPANMIPVILANKKMTQFICGIMIPKRTWTTTKTRNIECPGGST